MVTTNWADLNRDGRRLEGLIKQLYHTVRDNPQDPMIMNTYCNTIARLTHEKVLIAQTVLGVKDMLAKAKIPINVLH